jgi:hypothetical protein
VFPVRYEPGFYILYPIDRSVGIVRSRTKGHGVSKYPIDLKVKDLYWIIGRKSPASLESKALLYKTIIKSIWTVESNYGDGPANRISRNCNEASPKYCG